MKITMLKQYEVSNVSGGMQYLEDGAQAIAAAIGIALAYSETKNEHKDLDMSLTLANVYGLLPIMVLGAARQLVIKAYEDLTKNILA